MEVKDKAVELLNNFLAENNLELKVVVSYQGEASKASVALFDKIMAENNLTTSLAVGFKTPPLEEEPPVESSEPLVEEVVEGEVTSES